MKVEGSYPFAAPRDVLWPMLLDPTVLANILPGCEKLETIGENQFNGILKIKVGPVQGKFMGDVVMGDIQEPESCTISVDGKGAPGYVKGAGTLRLEADGDMTTLHYTGDANVGGRLASVGQRMLETSANAIIRQSLEGLGQQVQARMMAAASGELDAELITTPPPPPSQMQFAAGVVKNLAADYLEPENRDGLIKTGLIILGAIMVLRFISNWWTDQIAKKVAKRLAKR
ncbi:MAG: carbon monoxide dehydrogenase subunit G [Ardenticatenaceae bacterium]|nr:carbon monoxide dehydrogenase subunit G [Anaerolineales bacterium]MCB8937695.1 carbon monoxide dehydrogenase subunit G [Ardenticatenaceae bacterium]MCB8974264.1 carbon monoxide dehydrogenase subunit G [Ardenticatenaceae bacterium]